MCAGKRGRVTDDAAVDKRRKVVPKANAKQKGRAGKDRTSASSDPVKAAKITQGKFTTVVSQADTILAQIGSDPSWSFARLPEFRSDLTTMLADLKSTVNTSQ
eukprot:595892-Pyramimonas_sp.AAC.1